MTRIIVAFMAAILCGPTFATSDFFCNGDNYSIYIVVGTDDEDYTKDAVSDVTIYEHASNKSISLNNHDFIESNIVWIDSEEGYSGNILRMKLKEKSDGSITTIEVVGIRGLMNYRSRSYELECNWEK